MDDSPTAAINQNLIGVLPLVILSEASCVKRGYVTCRLISLGCRRF
jgi:hypothetical protein